MGGVDLTERVKSVFPQGHCQISRYVVKGTLITFSMNNYDSSGINNTRPKRQTSKNYY